MPFTGSSMLFGFCTCMRTVKRCANMSVDIICTPRTSSCGVCRSPSPLQAANASNAVVTAVRRNCGIFDIDSISWKA